VKTALIVGVTGQDGAHLSKLLLDKGYTVYGAHRRSSGPTLWRLQELGILDRIKLVSCELSEDSNVRRMFASVMPDEVYNLAAQSFVGVSFDCPVYTADTDALGTLRLLEAIREMKPACRFYQASSSEMFGKVQETPQRETTPFYPRSPYGIAKLFAHWTTVNYREAYGIHASSGILFNHEGEFRGAEFVTQKIVKAFVAMSQGRQSHLELGNLDARRDWGYAGDYVDGMWRMLQAPEGGTYVLATGVTHTVRTFVELVARAVHVDLAWRGGGLDEHGVHPFTGRALVRVNPAFYRPAEVDLLIGDATLAKRALGWAPTVPLALLVDRMVEAELRRRQP
jgi:GDPmannose 4,6-dehydratase